MVLLDVLRGNQVSLCHTDGIIVAFSLSIGFTSLLVVIYKCETNSGIDFISLPRACAHGYIAGPSLAVLEGNVAWLIYTLTL